MRLFSLKRLAGFSLLALIFAVSFQKSFAHCEIPCGIYEDHARIDLIKEHITTIEKSMNKINELSQSDAPDWNQLVRWVVNKEEHAKKIQDIVSQYFLHQRIKLPTEGDAGAREKYLTHLELLHTTLVYAMKTKQTTDLGYIKSFSCGIHPQVEGAVGTARRSRQHSG
jgi:nickel superoxide dismutase